MARQGPVTRWEQAALGAQAQQAVKYEGAAAVQTGFQMLGQVAARELFADPGVTRGLGELEKYVDSRKIEQALAPRQ